MKLLQNFQSVCHTRAPQNLSLACCSVHRALITNFAINLAVAVPISQLRIEAHKRSDLPKTVQSQSRDINSVILAM